MLPSGFGSRPSAAPGATDTPGHSGGTAPVLHRTSLFRSLNGETTGLNAAQSRPYGAETGLR
jgi:hypothetical protein